MGRQPCCEKVGLKRGRWTAEEDEILTKYIQENGEGSWRSLPKNAGLLRCGKSCRLRWINYLRSDLKRGNISAQEEEVIIKLHATLGNKWSVIAGHLQGRTDNEIKNYWNSHLSRKYYSIRRPGTDAGTGTGTETLPPVATANKRRGGRTSRWAMKKNKTYFPIPTKQSDVPKENDNTENPILGPSDIEECIQSLALPSPYQERENPSGASMFGPGEERENGVEENETWWLDEMIPTGIHGEDGLDPNKTWGLTEERENGIGTEISDGGGETGIFNPSTTSSSTEPLMDFEDGKLGFEWETDWGWEGVVDQGMILGDDENIFSSLWENDNNLEVDCDDKQNAMISWLLS